MTADRRSRIVIRANAILARAAVGILPALAVLFIGGTPTAARADLVIQIQDSSAPVGGVGAFDILLVNTGGTFQPGGFSVEVTTTGSGITFTGATTSTVTASYIFGTIQSPPLATLNSSTDLSASDTDFTAPGSVTLTGPETVGLARVTYTVDPGATPGTVSVSFMDPGDSLSDVNGFGIPFTATSGGTITIFAVPEPISLVSAVIGMTMVGAGLLLRARRRTA